MTRSWLAMILIGCGGSPPPPPRAVTAADLTPSASGPPVIAGALLEQRRTAGDKNIEPDGDVMDVMRSRGIGHVIGAFTYCVDATGHVTSVKTVKTTSVVPYDQKIEREIKDWAFTPIAIDGHPTAACSAAAINFTVR
jgi:hypothetical protein